MQVKGQSEGLVSDKCITFLFVFIVVCRQFTVLSTFRKSRVKPFYISTCSYLTTVMSYEL